MATDATPAYRGYRLQHLCTLWRILQAGDQEGIVFQLEGQEDLDILDNNGTLALSCNGKTLPFHHCTAWYNWLNNWT